VAPCERSKNGCLVSSTHETLTAQSGPDNGDAVIFQPPRTWSCASANPNVYTETAPLTVSGDTGAFKSATGAGSLAFMVLNNPQDRLGHVRGVSGPLCRCPQRVLLRPHAAPSEHDCLKAIRKGPDRRGGPSISRKSVGSAHLATAELADLVGAPTQSDPIWPRLDRQGVLEGGFPRRIHHPLFGLDYRQSQNLVPAWLHNRLTVSLSS
jgi:hypothetical protein